ncbi:MAG: transcription elongation factor GreA [Oscillospiraceae bacterium]|nr:MAG: transcription elongation factor GreA [Oscillospiraceae bacterium]
MSKMKTPVDEMTREEYQKLRGELEHLKTVERNDISEKIRVARGFGDLSENSEYDEAKNDQARLEARISRLEERLKNAQVVDNISTDTVTVGTKVVLLDMEFDEKTEYRIASSGSGDDSDNVVTVDSPVGQAIMGHAVGETVDVKTPNGQIYQMKILEIGK